MKGISIFVAAIILIAFVLVAGVITSSLIMDFTKTKEAEVSERSESAVECGMGVIHIHSVNVNGDLKVTVENMGETDLSSLKIVAYNQTGSYTYDATPDSVSVGTKVTLTSDVPVGIVTKVRVITDCPTVSDEKDTGLTTTTTIISFECDSCPSCNQKIADANPGDTIYLTANIDHTGECINLTKNTNITFDCQNHIIDGSSSAPAFRCMHSTPTNTYNTVKNCYVTHERDAIDITRCNHNTFDNITSHVNWWTAFDFYTSSNNRIINSYLNSTDNIATIFFYNSSNNEVINCTLDYNYDDGISFSSDSGNNTIRDSKILRTSSGYGIKIVDSGSVPNKIYNNIFNNTNNFYFSGAIYSNYWNTTKQSGDNVFNSNNPYIGGNYWTNSTGSGYSDTCTDSESDGFCDDAYIIDPGQTGNNTDYLPLSNQYVPPPSCGSYINFDTTLTENITGCTATILYINASDVTLDCDNHYLQSSGNYGINNTGHDNVTIKNCNVNMTNDNDNRRTILYDDSDNGTIENNTVITSTGTEGYGIAIYHSNYNSIQNNTIKLGETDYWSAAICVWCTASSSNYNNITWNTIKSPQSRAISIEFPSGGCTPDHNTVSENDIEGLEGLYFEDSEDNSITKNNFNVTSRGAYINSYSRNNIFTGNNFTRGIFIQYDSDYNTFTDNNIRGNIYGFYVWDSYNNNISGGSITANSQDYYIRDAGSTNSFRDSNFTASREIYFYDTTSWFNYNNKATGNIWLNTSISQSGENVNRVVSNDPWDWYQDYIVWTDSGEVTAYYNVSGLDPGEEYDIYDNGGWEDRLTATNGKIDFSIDLSGGDHEIEVVWYDGGGCFLAGTKITMSDGTEKNIEDIQIGDYVISYNLEKGRYEKAKVARTFEHKGVPHYLVINKVLRVTPNHPIYSEGRWVRADSLKEGDKLFIGWVETIEKVYGSATVYNLEVEKNHNYFAEGVLVHNK